MTVTISTLLTQTFKGSLPIARPLKGGVWSGLGASQGTEMPQFPVPENHGAGDTPSNPSCLSLIPGASPNIELSLDLGG